MTAELQEKTRVVIYCFWCANANVSKPNSCNTYTIEYFQKTVSQQLMDVLLAKIKYEKTDCLIEIKWEISVKTIEEMYIRSASMDILGSSNSLTEVA